MITYHSDSGCHRACAESVIDATGGRHRANQSRNRVPACAGTTQDHPVGAYSITQNLLARPFIGRLTRALTAFVAKYGSGHSLNRNTEARHRYPYPRADISGVSPLAPTTVQPDTVNIRPQTLPPLMASRCRRRSG